MPDNSRVVGHQHHCDKRSSPVEKVNRFPLPTLRNSIPSSSDNRQPRAWSSRSMRTLTAGELNPQHFRACGSDRGSRESGCLASNSQAGTSARSRYIRRDPDIKEREITARKASLKPGRSPANGNTKRKPPEPLVSATAGTELRPSSISESFQEFVAESHCVAPRGLARKARRIRQAQPAIAAGTL